VAGNTLTIDSVGTSSEITVVNSQDSAMPIRAESVLPPAELRPRRSFVQSGFGLIVLLALVVLSYRLMHAPIHGVHQASDCARVYAEARTYEEKLSADNLSYQDPARPGVDMRCGMVRAGAVGRAGR